MLHKKRLLYKLEKSYKKDNNLDIVKFNFKIVNID